jgi:CRISPR-associated protein Cst1
MNEKIFDFTGNPFVDAGIWSISRLVNKNPHELDKNDLNNVLNDVIPLYLTKKWSKNLYSVFPNNPITNPSVKNKKERYMELLKDLIKDITTQGKSGSCISCGKRDVIKRSGKDKIPLTGSGRLINYFSYGVDGADYCPACAFAVQFSPLMMYACGKLLLLHSNSKKIMDIWSRKAIKNVNKQLSTGKIIGCLNEKYTNPKNAFFHIIQDIVLEYDVRWADEAPSINCYHFTNYNQGPDLDIYHIPTPIFKFLAYIPQHEKFEDWMRIVKRGYKFVDWKKVKDENEYKNNPNLVYNNLLEGKSIIRFFLDRKNKEAIGGWDLLKNYLEEVKRMDEERVKAIKQVGDILADYIETVNDMKTLNRLETASNYKNYRNLLRIIIKKRISNGMENPLFTFDDYVNYLFPEGNLTWRETQDLILFRIYEKLQPWILQQGNQDELKIQDPEEEIHEEE